MIKRKSESTGSKTEKREAKILLFQHPGDVVVMSGFFQLLFQHAVPARHEWAAIHKNKQYNGVPVYSDDEHWTRFSHFMDLMANEDPRVDSEWAWRWNCTLRWHRNHFGACRFATVKDQKQVTPATQPVTIKMLPTLTGWSAHPNHFLVSTNHQ